MRIHLYMHFQFYRPIRLNIAFKFCSVSYCDISVIILLVSHRITVPTVTINGSLTVIGYMRPAVINLFYFMFLQS